MPNTRADLIRPASDVINQNRQRRNPSSTIFQFPEDMGAHAIIMNFKKYTFDRNDATRNTLLGPRGQEQGLTTRENYQGSVILPLPTNLQDSYNIQISTTELGAYGSMIAQAASEIENPDINLEQTARDIGSQLASSLVSVISNLTTPEGIRTARFFLGRQLEKIVSGSTTALDVGMGNIVNPHITLAFEGMQLKTHSFDWKFSPKNLTESERIKVISNWIRYNSLPKYSAFNESFQTTNNTLGPLINRPFLDYPSVVDIFFMGLEQEYFYFFKRCMIQNVTLNYAPEGLAVLKTGKPAFVSLSMTLTEQEIHTAKDYQRIDEVSDTLGGQVLG